MTRRHSADLAIDAPVYGRIAASSLVSKVVLALLGSVLLTLSAKTQVPFWPVPMTMQTFVVLLIGMTYGSRLAGATVLFYLCEGAAGLPIFAGTPERGIGLAYMAGPTGGYLFGFLLAAVVVGWLAERGWRRSVWRIAAAAALGHIVMLAPGLAWLATAIGWSRAWDLGIEPFILATIIKTALATAAIVALGRVPLARPQSD
jgi:biotin transport system substrate-specific component